MSAPHAWRRLTTISHAVAPVWRRRLTAVGLAVLAFGLVMCSQRDVGIARDETVYMVHGRRYAEWWIGAVTGKGVVNETAITSHFGGRGPTDNNREHPPLMKTLFGLSERLLHDRLGVASEVSAYRLPTAALHALLVALVFLMTQALWGWAEGFVAALLLLFLPRLFFHAGLACFDAPITALWFATVYAWWRALSSRPWMWAVGVVFGLALATKHNALILPGAIGIHYLIVAARSQRERWRARVRAAGTRSVPGLIAGVIGASVGALAAGAWRRRPVAILSFAVLGPATLFALWPWLWFDTAEHVRAWIAFHLHHVHYNFEYLGRNWNHPPFPWHVAVVTTLLTVPAATLAAAAVGTGAWIARVRRGDRPDADAAPGLLLALSAAAAVGPFFLGSTPIFGAEKHWAPAMPSLAIAAGVGAVWTARQAAFWLWRQKAWLELRRPLIEAAAIALVAAAVVGAAAVETARAQPYALSHYNAIAGGAPGGADLGMNRQFWGYAARGTLSLLRTEAPPPGAPPRPVYTHDASPAWGFYQRAGLIPSSLPDAGNETAGIERSQLALVIHELHFNRHDYLVWKAYGTVQPVYVLRFQGVPIVSVYRRPTR